MSRAHGLKSCKLAAAAAEGVCFTGGLLAVAGNEANGEAAAASVAGTGSSEQGWSSCKL